MIDLSTHRFTPPAEELPEAASLVEPEPARPGPAAGEEDEGSDLTLDRLLRAFTAPEVLSEQNTW